MPIASQREYTIGALAKRARVAPSVLRYYEKEGLLVPGRRTASGYRVYGQDAEKTLLFINRAKRLGFSLDDIRQFLAAGRAEAGEKPGKKNGAKPTKAPARVGAGVTAVGGSAVARVCTRRGSTFAFFGPGTGTVTTTVGIVDGADVDATGTVGVGVAAIAGCAGCVFASRALSARCWAASCSAALTRRGKSPPPP